MTPFRPALLLICAALALSGCTKAAPPPSGKAAGGEVLPGTISDAMLNLDRSQAQAPLQPVAEHQAPADVASDDASGVASDVAPDAGDAAKVAPAN